MTDTKLTRGLNVNKDDHKYKGNDKYGAVKVIIKETLSHWLIFFPK